jgi:peptidoglycan/LPS O-acetylase OafA/YrhL
MPSDRPAPADPVPSSSRPAPARLTYLDGLRGLAALMVVLFHMWEASGSPRLPLRLAAPGPAGLPNVTVDLLSPIGAMGGSRVSLFFVLSGFLLYLPFASPRRSGGGAAAETLWGWLRRRFRRLAPAYYAAIALSLTPLVWLPYLTELWRRWALHLPPRPPYFGNTGVALPASLFFLHGVVPGAHIPDFNPPLWTITAEVQLYLAFPPLAALATWRGPSRPAQGRAAGLAVAVALAAALSVAYRAFLYAEIGAVRPLAVTLDAAGVGGPADAGWLDSAYFCLCNTFLGRWAEFAAGMGAAWLVAAGRVPAPRYTVPAFAICLSWFLVLRSDIAVGGWMGWLFLAMERAPSPLADAVGGAAFALLLLVCAGAAPLARALSWRPLAAVGAVSFSLYLTHSCLLWTVNKALAALLGAAGGPSARAFVEAAPTAPGGSLGLLALDLMVALPLLLVAARLFWRAFERPFLSRQRREGLEQAPAPAPATTAAGASLPTAAATAAATAATGGQA